MKTTTKKEIAFGGMLFLAVIVGGVMLLNEPSLPSSTLSPGEQPTQATSTPQTQPAPPVAQQRPLEETRKITPKEMSQASSALCSDNQCLIAAAAQCQPISTTIAYTGIQDPIINGLLRAGETRYELQGSSGSNNCTLTMFIVSATASLSEAGRVTARAKGQTDAAIDSQLKMIQDSLKSTVGMKTVCPGDTNAIVAYLNAAKTGTFDVHYDGQATTYTMPSGKTLTCTATLPNSATETP